MFGVEPTPINPCRFRLRQNYQWIDHSEYDPDAPAGLLCMMYEMEWMRNEKMEYSSSSMRRLFKVVQATNGSSDDDSNNDNECIENNNTT